MFDRRSKICALLLPVVACSIAAGCSGNKPKPHQVFLMPAPDIYDDDAIDAFEDDELMALVQPPVLYATDRRPAEPGDKKFPFYSDERAYSVRLGKATIRLGDDDSITWEEARRISLLKNRTANYPLEITGVEEYGVLDISITPFDDTPRDAGPGRAFAEEIDRQLERSNSSDVYIYVHGYKVNFENPVLVASELWHYMGYNGAFIAYAWPATFNFTAYFSDIEDATQSARQLRDLIVHISKNTSARRVHLVGYSTGTRLVTRTIADLSLIAYGMEPEQVAEDISIGNVLLVGSDMDRAILAGHLLDGLLRVCDSFTIYQSAADKTLDMSRMVFGKDRVGKAIDSSDRPEGAKQFLQENPGIRIVDISHAADIERNNGHSYFRTSPWVSSDVLMTLRYDLAPAERGLVLAEDGLTWVFPEDYVARLRELLRAALAAN